MSSNIENNSNESSADEAAEPVAEQADSMDSVESNLDGAQAAGPDQAVNEDVPAEAAVAELAAELIAEAEAEAEEPVTDGPHLTVVPVEELSAEHILNVIEAALFAADEALTVDRLFKLFVPGELADEGGRVQVREALARLEASCEERGVELKKVASGYRMQVRQNLSPWVSRLWEEKPPRYTRALLETMALIAYKQPATRGDIEEVRGVAVSSNIMRTLLERGWIRELGQRDVPGRPSMYGTTKEFLDYFNLSSIDQLPSLPEIRELVEPAQIPDEPVATEQPEAAAGDSAATDATDSEAQEAEPVVRPEVDPEPDMNAVEDGQPLTGSDTLTGVAGVDSDAPESDAAGSSEGVTSRSTPVFADNEVLVVSELASVEVQQASDLSTLPSAESQE